MVWEVLSWRQFALLLLVGGAVVGVLGVDPTVVNPHSTAPPPRTADDVRLVSPTANAEQRLWPFTSRDHDFDSLTLPINVVFADDAASVRDVLARGGEESWNRTTGEWGVTNREGSSVVVRGTTVQWRSTTGANRFVYVDTDGPGGRWLDETDQLHDGTYLGTRYHLRLYRGETGANAWTAVQAHHEHWDWFRLRHTVGSLSRARHYVEREFYGEPVLDDIDRVRFGNGGIADADGWVTRIDLRPLGGPLTLSLLGALVVGRVTVGRPEGPDSRSLVDGPAWRYPALFAALVALLLLVRIGGVAVEQQVLTDSPKVVAGGFYLLLVLGLPALTVGLSRPLDGERAFLTAFLGLGAAILADYWYMGITIMPVSVVFHRLLLMCSLGLLAAGAARYEASASRQSSTLAAGVIAWLATLAWPLLGVF